MIFVDTGAWIAFSDKKNLPSHKFMINYRNWG